MFVILITLFLSINYFYNFDIKLYEKMKVFINIMTIILSVVDLLVG